MRITIVQGAFLPIPPLMGGAVEKVWFGLGKEFARRGHQVTHISRRYQDLPAAEVIQGVHHRRVPGFAAPKSLALLKGLDLLYSLMALRVLPEADILVTNTFWLPVLVQSPRPGQVYVNVQRYPKGQMKLYRRAARLQTVSSFVAQAIVTQEPLAHPRVRVIPNPLPENVNPTEILGPFSDREPWLLYVGRIHPEKGLALLLGAFQQLLDSGVRGWRLVMVGPWETEYGGGGEDYYQALKQQFCRIEKQVDWVGGIFDQGKLASYYQRARLFVYPSLAAKGETFGLAPLEAMACGCPTLVSNLDCFKDFLKDGVTGFVFPSSQEAALGQKLQELLQDPQRLARVGKQGYELAQHYTLERVAEQYLADFADLLAP
ncbi:glycosyltransferase family 4 protein [Anthocerotibacter panamensis]|uniref:glycosyltransferase family 4 protein n=1 Tax=Anthocerotibacter panamensis TaxID=2857077 RepID=UPI001C40833B|nr:glycosyltransferase family 4 protein [Anthocerotibacter panamensis]